MALRVITFKLDEETLEELDRLAMRKGKTRSELIRRAIEQYLMDHKQKNNIITARRIRVYL